MNIDRDHLVHDLQLVGAALGPLGILLGLAGHDFVTVTLAAAIGTVCVLRLAASTRVDRARLALAGLGTYAAGAAAILLSVMLGQIVVAVPGFAIAELAVAALSLPVLFVQAAAGATSYGNQ